MSSDDEEVPSITAGSGSGTTTTNTTTIAPSFTLSLPLEGEEGAYLASSDNTTEKYPYRLIQIGNDILVYGGDDGLLVRVVPAQQDQQQQQQPTSTTTVVRRWEDDTLRAIAVSPNQRTVMVGVDSGEVEIYSFDDYQVAPEGTGQTHPFCATDNAEDEDDNDMFLSQSDKITSPRPSDTMKPGPRGEAPVRDIVFLNDNVVAIAYESDLKLVNLNDENMATTYYLSKESKSQHGGAGVRGMSWNPKYEILTTLGLDGSVCFWNCPLSDPASAKLWKKESNLKVSKKDVGEVLGADSWDRSSRPWDHGDYLAIPGSTLWQLIQWTCSDLPEKDKLNYTQLFQTDTVHSKTMVLIRSRGMQWISTDRAGEVVVWHLVSFRIAGTR
jgi:WD40 repeat protein